MHLHLKKHAFFSLTFALLLPSLEAAVPIDLNRSLATLKAFSEYKKVLDSTVKAVVRELGEDVGRVYDELEKLPPNVAADVMDRAANKAQVVIDTKTQTAIDTNVSFFPDEMQQPFVKFIRALEAAAEDELAAYLKSRTRPNPSLCKELLAMLG